MQIEDKYSVFDNLAGAGGSSLIQPTDHLTINTGNHIQQTHIQTEKSQSNEQFKLAGLSVDE